MDDAATPRPEIERKFLLRALPLLPPHAEAVQIEQGYIVAVGDEDIELPESARAGAIDQRGRLAGRIRRATYPDGRVICTNTVKRGRGLVRQESEREISEAQFEAHWPLTVNARLHKTRHRVAHGELVWEIDQFHELDLVMAEVELPDPEHDALPPPWLAEFIECEVTGEQDYRNLVLARRSAQAAKLETEQRSS